MTRNDLTAIARLRSEGLTACGQKLSGDEGIELNAQALVSCDDIDQAVDTAIAAIAQLRRQHKTRFAGNESAPEIRVLARGLSDDADSYAFIKDFAKELGGQVRDANKAEDGDLFGFGNFVRITTHLGWQKPVRRAVDHRKAFA